MLTVRCLNLRLNPPRLTVSERGLFSCVAPGIDPHVALAWLENDNVTAIALTGV